MFSRLYMSLAALIMFVVFSHYYQYTTVRPHNENLRAEEVIHPQIFDVLIIGGGPAGLATATALARQLHTAILFSNGVFRNARASHMHNVIGWDHQSPATFRAKAKSDLLERYDTITFQENTTISLLRRLGNGYFEASDEHGNTWEGQKVVLAHGITDVPPTDLPGYDECWARGIFHCLFCHGYEERGAERVGVLATGKMLGVASSAIRIAHMARRLAKSVTIYTDGSRRLAAELKTALQHTKAEILVDARKVLAARKLPKGSEVGVRFHDGEDALGYLVHKPDFRLNGDFAAQLNLGISEQGRYKTSQQSRETGVKGVFAVGDCGTPMEGVSVAAWTGAIAAAGAASQIQEESA